MKESQLWIEQQLEAKVKDVWHVHSQPIVWLNQNFRISRYNKKIFKNCLYQSKENLFCKIIMPKSY